MAGHVDIHVHKGEELNRQYFDCAVESVSRCDDPDGDGEYVMIKFVNGGTMSVHTHRPIMLIEPERQ